jgi:integrase
MTVTRDEQRGTWFFVVDLTSPDGRRRQVRRRGFETKKAATAAERRILDDADHGIHVDRSRLTLGQFLVDHWLPGRAAQLRPSTVEAYSIAATKWIIPKLGAVKLQQLDPAMVAQFVASILADGRSPKYVRNIHGVLRKALADARRLGLVRANAAADVELPQVRRGDLRAWDGEQLARFLHSVAGDRLGPLWRFLVATGVRRGEALGLRWSDVDLDAGSVQIRRSRVVAGGRVVEGAPKTKAGQRSIAIDAATAAVLRSWKSSQSAERLVMGAGWGNDVDCVFTQPDGTPLYPQTITATFKRISLDLGLPTIGVHGLRHSSATMMISSGLSPKVVSQRLGHATVAITLDTYSHVLPAHDQAAADFIGRSLDEASQTVPRDSVTNL